MPWAPDTICWEAPGGRTAAGYGQTRREGRRVYAHRAAYEDVHGSIPDGFEIDHLCRNRGCINPDHLEAVTPAENRRRVPRIAAQAVRTHCPVGHAYDASNTRLNGGRRVCRTCHRDRERARARRAA